MLIKYINGINIEKWTATMLSIFLYNVMNLKPQTMQNSKRIIKYTETKVSTLILQKIQVI